MHFVFDLLQGIGIAASIGVRPFLPVLLTGALASANAGLDFDGTDFAFLESWVFLLAVLLVVGVLEYLDRKRVGNEPPSLLYTIGAVTIALGALVAAGSLADRGNSIIPGVILGAAAALLGFLAARSLFGRVRRRLDPEAAAALPVYAEGVALLGAGLSILLPPIAVLIIVGQAFLLAGGRRREGEKYAGLRILR
jgi:hypothetical protein